MFCCKFVIISSDFKRLTTFFKFYFILLDTFYVYDKFALNNQTHNENGNRSSNMISMLFFLDSVNFCRNNFYLE